MAAASDAIWAIDLGNSSLKALHLMVTGEVVQVIGFDHIPHGKILSSSGISAAEKEELIAIALRQFVQRNEVDYDPLIVSVPSQNSFARFVTLPPVEQKRLPEIVQFEAAQQIPFDMSEIQWDWQLMSDEDDPEKKVGIFAIKNEVVNGVLEHLEREDLQVSFVQITPMALYNYLLFDRPDLVRSDKRATVMVNVGAEGTDLVVCTASGVWQRFIVMGGNAFTKAIADTFKLNFEKAEKLKRTAPVSKYARQIFQAMRPVFTDWAAELQRSLGFYTSSNPDVKLSRVIAMGGGTKLRGLLKYLQQTIQIPVEKPDAFKRLAVTPGLSSAKFHENVGDFGVVYGLGLQGLGMARIESNLLPKSIARSMAWAGKTKYFVGAAVLLLTVSLMCLGRVGLDRITYARNDPTRNMVKSVVNRADNTIKAAGQFEQQQSEFEQRIRKQFEWFQHRDIVARLHELVISALPNARSNPEQRPLYEAFAAGDVERVIEVPRQERKQLFLTNMTMYFTDDLATAQFGETAMMRRDALMQMAAGEEGGMYEDEMMAEMREIYGDAYMQQFGFGGATEEEKHPGFVVSVVGYSPYKDIGALLDPPNVGDDPGRWGFMTRMENLDQFVTQLEGFADANSPFALYSREAEHFRFRKGIVDLDQDVPMGVGVVEFIPDVSDGTTSSSPSRSAGMAYGFMSSGTQILVDPMTRERISAKPLTDQFGKPMYNAMGKPELEVHDYWFSLDFKLEWANAPQEAAGSSTSSTDGAGAFGG